MLDRGRADAAKKRNNDSLSKKSTNPFLRFFEGEGPGVREGASLSSAVVAANLRLLESPVATKRCESPSKSARIGAPTVDLLEYKYP